jgi:hypothetical protein
MPLATLDEYYSWYEWRLCILKQAGNGPSVVLGIFKICDKYMLFTPV